MIIVQTQGSHNSTILKIPLEKGIFGSTILPAFRDSVAVMNVSFICLTRLSRLPDHAKVSDPTEDYILSLHQHFLIHPTACVTRLRMKENFAKTTLAASVTNTLFKTCSDVIRVGRTFFKEYVLAMVHRTTPWSKSSSDTFDVNDGGCFGCSAARPVPPSSLPHFSER